MKILSITFAALMFAVIPDANAWSLWEINGAKMDIDGKDIRVAGIHTVGSGHIFHSNDKELENGVYVFATKNSSSNEILPHTTARIRDYLRSRGFNVKDKPDGCALAIKFEVSDLSIDGSSVAAGDQSVGLSQSPPDPSGSNLAGQVSAGVLATRMSGPLSGAIAFGMAGSWHYVGDALELNSVSIVDPTLDKLGQDSARFVRDTNGITARTAPKKTDPNTTTADLLTLMTKAWADKYFIKDEASPAAPANASKETQ